MWPLYFLGYYQVYYPMLSTLTNTQQPLYTYIGKAFIASIVPALSIALCMFLIVFELLNIPFPTETSINDSPMELIILLGIVTPFVETVIMCIFISVLSKFSHNKQHIAIMSAIIWAVLHSIKIITWGFVVAWSFYVFSLAYLTWREQSPRKGFFIAFMLHALQNIFVGIWLIII